MAELAKKFGARVRQLRLDRGLTQPQLADLAGLSDTWIRRVEAGSVAATLTTVEALSTALAMEPADLFPKGSNRPNDQRFAEAAVDLSDEEVAWLIQGARLIRARGKR